MNICKIEDCSSAVYARGWCSKHWQRWYKKGSPYAITKEQHRLRKSSEYNSWHNMKVRCYWIKSRSYVDYGARGIVVCDRWRNSFMNFYKDMGPKPTKAHSIERVNNNGNYEPSNCRWALGIDQANNNRHNHLITISGETKTMAQWARQQELNYKTVQTRINQLGWPVDKALGF